MQINVEVKSARGNRTILSVYRTILSRFIYFYFGSLSLFFSFFFFFFFFLVVVVVVVVVVLLLIVVLVVVVCLFL